MKAVFTQMETEVAKCSVDKKYFEIEKKELSLDNDRLLEHIICQNVMNVVMHGDVHNVLSVNTNYLDNDNLALESLKIENDRLMELLISQDLVHTAVNFLAAINDYKSMQQSFVDEYNETLVLKDEFAKKNDMIDKVRLRSLALLALMRHALSTHTIVSTLMYQSPLRSPIPEYKEKYYDLAKLHAPVTTEKTNNSRSHKVEAQPRIAKSNLNNTNRISKTVCNENVKHSVLNANSEFVCATCHECMFDAIHDRCVRSYLNDVNARVKSKSVKSRSAKSKKKEIWKPTGKIYTKVLGELMIIRKRKSSPEDLLDPHIATVEGYISGLKDSVHSIPEIANVACPLKFIAQKKDWFDSLQKDGTDTLYGYARKKEKQNKDWFDSLQKDGTDTLDGFARKKEKQKNDWFDSLQKDATDTLDGYPRKKEKKKEKQKKDWFDSLQKDETDTLDDYARNKEKQKKDWFDSLQKDGTDILDGYARNKEKQKKDWFDSLQKDGTDTLDGYARKKEKQKKDWFDSLQKDGTDTLDGYARKKEKQKKDWFDSLQKDGTDTLDGYARKKEK
ncbi:hypothetical protein Tco_0084077 [Tanacetum coccineum]